NFRKGIHSVLWTFCKVRRSPGNRTRSDRPFEQVMTTPGHGLPDSRIVLSGPDREGRHMNPNQALWEKGDFTRIAATMRESGEALVASLGITPGLRVLDLGSGDGTTALPEARRGADVLAVDIARNLVEAGNKRAQAEGLANCRFQQGDASNLSELP